MTAKAVNSVIGCGGEVHTAGVPQSGMIAILSGEKKQETAAGGLLLVVVITLVESNNNKNRHHYDYFETGAHRK